MLSLVMTNESFITINDSDILLILHSVQIYTI